MLTQTDGRADRQTDRQTDRGGDSLLHLKHIPSSAVQHDGIYSHDWCIRTPFHGHAKHTQQTDRTPVIRPELQAAIEHWTPIEVQCCFTSTETAGTITVLGTRSPGRPSRLSHSSRALPIRIKSPGVYTCRNTDL